MFGTDPARFELRDRFDNVVPSPDYELRFELIALAAGGSTLDLESATLAFDADGCAPANGLLVKAGSGEAWRCRVLVACARWPIAVGLNTVVSARRTACWGAGQRPPPRTGDAQSPTMLACKVKAALHRSARGSLTRPGIWKHEWTAALSDSAGLELRRRDAAQVLPADEGAPSASKHRQLLSMPTCV